MMGENAYEIKHATMVEVPGHYLNIFFIITEDVIKCNRPITASLKISTSINNIPKAHP